MNNRRTAFTLVEVLLVVVIIASLAALAAVAIFPMRNQANVDLTKAKVEKVMSKIELYAGKLDYPTAEQGLKALVEKPTFEKPEMDKNWFGPYLSYSDMKDAWGSDLTYKLDDVTDSSGNVRKVPRVYSWGPNKTDDSGEGDDIKNQGWADESAAAGK
jgi:general secretion pathway protein G